MNEMADVLIIGSGASGAAAAWSLADTKMRILCLEQGDWMKQSDYPSNGRDWEARVFGDFAVCNGVGTPRLLLNSASARFPNGLANSSGLAGKNLMFHPYAQVYGYVDEVLDGNHGPPLCLWSKEFHETDSSRDFVRG